MQYRPLGRTGLTVPQLSYGASSLGGVFRDIDEDAGVRAVHAAVDGGMNLIDVSPYYGITRAETVLGRALKQIDRDRYILSTKAGRYGPDFADFDFSADRITRSIDESLARLNVDHVDILLAHDIEFGSIDQIVNETLPAMQRLKTQGKTRFIGISALPLVMFTRVVDRLPPGTLDVILSYCHYELNDTALLDIVPRMQSAGIGVISASPTGMGLLTHRDPPDWHPAPDAVKAACRKAAEYCAARGVNLTQLAIQFAIANPDVSTTLVSTADPAKAEQNLRWVHEPVDETMLSEVRDILAPVHNLTWTSGHPENNDYASGHPR